VLSAVVLTPDRGAYLEEQVAQSRDDYYAGRGESPGAWFGSAAAALGLEGEVVQGGLERLIDGCHPLTGERLRRPIRPRMVKLRSLDPETGGRVVVERVSQPVGGFDFVFSAPKSVSLAAALAPAAVRREVVAAHHAAVTATLGLLEREACGVRLGKAGAEHAKRSGIVAALYVHRTSRERDPQLHTHCAIANLTQGQDGAWRALDSRLLLRGWKRTLGYVYQAALRREIAERLGWAWHHPENGLAELVAWPEPVLREFSTRRTQIEQALAEHGGSGWKAGQVATLATRAPKSVIAPDLAAERDHWRARAAEHGLDAERLASVLTPGPALVAASPAELRAIGERLAGRKGLTEKENAFRRADVLRAWADALPAGATITHLEALTDWYLAQPAFAVALLGDRYTTPDLLERERALLALVDAGRDTRTAVLPPRLVDRVVASAPVRLSDEQERVVHALTTSGHAIENLEAVAGSGKTTVCGVIAAAYEAGGYQVIGATPTARAARELAAVGVKADTIDAILTRLRNRPAAAPRRLVVIADENGMAGTRHMCELAVWARSGDAKIIQVGDSHQLLGVPASGAFAAITRRHGAERLIDVRRQRDDEEIRALADLRAGLPERYLAHQLEHRRLRVARDQTTAINEATSWWLHAADDHGPEHVALITRNNELRGALNTLVRRLRTLRGELDGPAVAAAGVEVQRGDRIICRHNDHSIGVDNGTRGTVLQVDRERHQLDICTDDGRRLVLRRPYLDAGHVEHAYALTAHNLQGGTVETACVVSHPDDHSARWTTACTRARAATHHVVVDEAPTAGELRTPTVARLLETMARDVDGDLATEHLLAPRINGPDGRSVGNELRAMGREPPGLEL
jgi:conjugative relaxase-like TrwC/TraI family protein